LCDLVCLIGTFCIERQLEPMVDETQLMIFVQGGAGGTVIGFLGLMSYLPGVDTRLCYFRWTVAVGHHFDHFNSSEHFFVDT
jgi:hypothetical protein